MRKLLLYGRHVRYGGWLEQVFSHIYGDSVVLAMAYRGSEVAVEAKGDREYIEEQAIRWFILSLYGFYLFEILMDKSTDEYGDSSITLQRADVVFTAMTEGFMRDETPSKLTRQLVRKWGGISGVSPEYMVTESLMSNFNFSYMSDRNAPAFREANIVFFQKVREQFIRPALNELFGPDDKNVQKVLHSTGYYFNKSGLYNRK